MSRGEILPIKEALVRLTVIRRRGLNAVAQFVCESCKRLNNIPHKAEGKSSIGCGQCGEINYLSAYTVIEKQI